MALWGIVHLFVCLFVRSFGRSVVRSFGRSVVRSFGRSVRSVRSVRSFVRLMNPQHTLSFLKSCVRFMYGVV